MSGLGGMPKRSGSEEQTSWADAAPPPRVLSVSELYLQGHIPLPGTSEVSAKYLVPSKWEEEGTRRHWDPRRLPSFLWHDLKSEVR